MQGTMKTTVKLTGTRLRIEAGTRVTLWPADNLPSDSGIDYFARPFDGFLSVLGVEAGEDDSIGISADDVCID